MLPLFVRPEAQADLLEARDWYNGQRSGLGQQFIDSVEEILAQVQTQPEILAPAFKEVRRGKIRRFPYVVYYRTLSDRIEILAVLHGSRDARAWQKRT